MPFKSEAQRKWMHANFPTMAKQWERDTSKGKKLPEHVKKAKKAKKGMTRLELAFEIPLMMLVAFCFMVLLGGATHFYTDRSCNEHHPAQAVASPRPEVPSSACCTRR